MSLSLDGEEWRAIPNTKLLYASNHGRIRDRFGSYLEADYVDQYNVPIIIDEYGSSTSHIPIWYMVFRAFVEHSNDSYGVLFLDGDTYNSNIDNLAFTLEREGEIKTYYPVMSVDKDGKIIRTLDRRSSGRVLVVETGEIYSSANEAARAIGGQQPNVHMVLNGIRNHHKGYTFRYIDK